MSLINKNNNCNNFKNKKGYPNIFEINTIHKKKYYIIIY